MKAHHSVHLWSLGKTQTLFVLAVFVLGTGFKWNSFLAQRDERDERLLSPRSERACFFTKLVPKISILIGVGFKVSVSKERRSEFASYLWSLVVSICEHPVVAGLQ